MRCTQCQSDNVQSLRVIYESGTHRIETSSHTIGGGVGGGGLGFGGGLGSANTTTRGTQQSILANKVAPPSKKSFLPAVVFIGIGILSTFVSAPTYILLIGILVGAFLAYRASTYNKEEFPPLYDAWSRSWHCNKCGTIYRTT